MILHLQTKIETVFGLSDEQGNVIKKPVTLQLDRFDKSTWLAAFIQLLKVREELQQTEAKQSV